MRSAAKINLLLLSALMVAACSAAGADFFMSFEARCAKLPPPRFEVVEVPVTYGEDHSHSIDQLTIRSGERPEMHLTFGLTTANFGHQSEYELRSVDDPAGARTCGTPSIRVELSMQPMMVYIANEVSVGACPRDATFSHEMKHVAVFRQTLADAARDLRTELPARLGAPIRRAGSQAELERQFNAAITDFLSTFFRGWHATLTARQAAVDSPQESARVRNACPP
jgi:hypothetical protein